MLLLAIAMYYFLTLGSTIWMYYFLTLGSSIWSEDAKDTAIAQEKTDFLTFYGSCCRFLGFYVCLMHQNFQNLWIWIGLAFSITKYWIVSYKTWKQSRVNLVVHAQVSYAEFTKSGVCLPFCFCTAPMSEFFCRNPWTCAFWLVQMFRIMILIGQISTDTGSYAVLSPYVARG